VDVRLREGGRFVPKAKTALDLSEYIEKQDYRFSSKERTRTEESVGRNLTQLVGTRGIERTRKNIENRRGEFLMKLTHTNLRQAWRSS
jgi:hypothetical protein